MLEPQPTIRDATSDDLLTVHAVTQAAYEQIKGIIGEQAHVFGETVNDLAHRMADGWMILLAESNRQIVGTIRCREHEGEMYLGRLAVLPDEQHAGIGRALVAAVEARGRELNLPTVRLGAYEDITVSRPYYERLGYHAAERVELRSAPGRYFWVMRKKL
jgi:predicted N-acetyltransferase YhbS